MPSPRFITWVALFAAIIGGASLLFAQSGNDEPIVPIQRIFLQPDRAAKELEKVPQGTLLVLPRQEFEDRLERVRRVVQARAQKPRLTRAHYSAELLDRAFANGSGQWTLAHPGNAAAILPIDSLSLALAKARWNDGSDAILAEFDGKTLGLLVNPMGNPTCLFDWSARGTPINDGMAFTLAVPFCPLTTFELKLPTDHWLSVPKGTAVVTGPHDTETPAKRLWKMQITGAKPIDITVRKLTQPKGPAPTIFARVESTQHLTRDRIAIEHEFQIDILNGSVGELVLEGSGSLQPYQVALPGGEVTSWQWKEVAAKKDAKGKLSPASGILTIQFPQPLQGKIKSLQVKSVCVPTGVGTWTSPALRMRDALSRGETLQIRVQPDVAVGRWDYGSFQPTNLVTEPDGTQILNLADTTDDKALTRRPTMVLPAKRVDLLTSESCQWHVGSRGASLNAEIQYALTRGELTELRLKMPVPALEYQVELIEMQPAELLHGWRLDGNNLVVELKQRLTSAKKTTLKVHLRTTIRAITAGPRRLDYPDLEPLDSARRQASVAILVDPIFQPQLMNSSVPPAPLDDGVIEKNGTQPSYRFALRDQRLHAVLRVVPQPVQAQLRGKHSLTLSDQHALLRSRWEAQPIVGEPEYLDFRCPPSFPVWKVKDEGTSLKIHHWERLPWQESLPHLLTFGAPTGLHALAAESMLPSGTLWRFHLTEPLRSKASFTVEAELPPGLVEEDWRQVSLLMPGIPVWGWMGGLLANEVIPKSAGGKIWSVPLMTPVQRTNAEVEVAIESADEPISKWASDSSFETPAALKADKATANLTLHQSAEPRSNQLTSITLWTNPATRPTSQLELCDEARLSSYVYRDGRTYHRIQFRLWHCRSRKCEVKLPADLHVLAVKVHDQWLDRLEVASSPAEVQLSMPFDQNGEYVRYEILAQSGSPRSCISAPGLQEISMPRVQWPVTPLEVRTRLFLENGLTPLNAAALSRVGVPRRIAEQTETPRWLRQTWNWGQAWLPIAALSDVTIKLESQKNAVLSAERKFRSAANKQMKLSQALDRFALDHLKDISPLVIDRLALQSLGLSADAVVSQESLSPQTTRPFWEKLKLVYVSCPSGSLLTSVQRLQSMGINPNDPTEAAALDDAIQEAILHGRDASAGFYLVPAWLKLTPDDRFGFTSESTIGWKHTDESLEMTEWELRPDQPPPGSVVVVDSVNARIAAAFMAFLAALVLWKIHRALQPVAFFRVCILVMAAGVSVVVWSSPAVRELFLWPTFFVAVVGALFGVIRLVRQRGKLAATGPSTFNHPATTAALLGIAVLAVNWGVSAQTPTPRTYPVYVINGAKPKVLVGPDLIARLDELEKQTGLGSAGAVLVSAKYTGKVKDSQAKIDVLYEIHSIKDKATLVIPLTGVQLAEGAFLDGAPVFLAPHKSGYSVPIRGAGPHHLRLSFSAAVRVAPKTEQLDLQFIVPRLSQNEITLQWHNPVQAVHSPHGLGEQKTLTDPRQAVKEWQAQLGYENEFHLRWSNTAAATAPKTIDVKEAHFWDLRPGSLSLLSTFHYAFGKGSLAQMVVAIPDGLQVRSVEALAAPLSAPAVPIVIKQWTITGKGANRRLNVDLAQPVTGHVTLNLELVPQAFGQKTKLLLPLPAPQQGKSTGLLGYRTDAAEVRSIAQNLVAVQSIPGDSFEKQWKAQNGLPLPPTSRAKSFQRTNLQPAALELWIEPGARQAAFHLNWEVDQHYADVHGKFTITSPLQDLLMVEIFVDTSMTLANVAGADVQRWQLHDSLLQVWLKQPRKETTLEITGWRKSTPGQKSLALPSIYPLETQISAATLTLRPAPGVQLKTEQLRGLHADPVDRLRFAIDKLPYFTSFLLSANTGLPEATMLTKVHASESRIEASIGIRLISLRGRLPELKVHLKDWDDQAWQLDGAGAIVQQTNGKEAKHAIWTLKFPAGQPEEVFISLRGRIARNLPLVEIEGASLHGHWLAWRDLDMLADLGNPVANQRGIKEKLTHFQTDPWFKQAPLWNGAAAPKSLQATLPKATGNTSSRVLASSEESWLSEDRDWLHEASFWVESQERTDLRFKFPAQIDMLSAWADGHVQTVAHPGPLDYVVILDPNSTTHHIKLRWKYADSAVRISAPIIAAIQIDQVALPAHERLVWIPTGMTRANSNTISTPTFPGRLLHEAQEHLEISAAFAQDSARSKDVAARQQSFYACIRQAEYALSIVRTADPMFDFAPLAKNLSDLKDRNAVLAKERRYEDQRKIAEKSRKIPLPTASIGDPRQEATPFLLSPDLASLKLQSAAEQQMAQHRTVSEITLLAAIFLFVVSYFRRGWSLLSFAAPEIAIGLLVVAMTQFGIGLLGIALVAAFAGVRLLWVAAALRKRIAHEPIGNHDANPPTASQPPSAP